ncbi:metallophosphoesterase, partial [gut metagenome]
TEVIYVRGNHDDCLEALAPMKLANISIVRDYILQSGDRQYFITHGDVFDSVTSNMKWLAKLGDVSYNALLRLNAIYNKYRLKQGKPYFSFSQVLKHKVKQAVSVISGFETMLADLARSKKCDGVICGHIHYPENRDIDGIHYLNSGDWVESMSALVETFDGQWSIVKCDVTKEGLV